MKIKRRGQDSESKRDRAIMLSVVLCVFAAVTSAAGGYLLETGSDESLPVIVDIIEETSAEETAADTQTLVTERTEVKNTDAPETGERGTDRESMTPVTSAAAVETGGTDSAGLININTATAEELDSLYGIGEKLAAAIIEYRSEQPFETVEDIMNVKGIGEGKFEKIKDRITC